MRQHFVHCRKWKSFCFLQQMNQQSGKIIMFIGLAIVLVGLIWYLFGNRLHFLGRLPGDIRVERENYRFYFPLTTMILASVLVSLLLHLIKKFL